MTHDELRQLSPQRRLARARTVELPFSEVCCHMHVAGERLPVVPVENGMAQILQRDGTMFSFPITNGEAGVMR